MTSAPIDRNAKKSDNKIEVKRKNRRHTNKQRDLENTIEKLKTRITSLETQVATHSPDIAVTTATSVSHPAQSKELLSLQRYASILREILQQSAPEEISTPAPAKYRKIHIICLLLPQYASLKITTTDADQISTSTEFSSHFIPRNNPALGSIHSSVFSHLQENSRVDFTNSNMNSHSLSRLSEAIRDMSQLRPQDTYTFAHIALGARSGQIKFEQPDKLTIETFS